VNKKSPVLLPVSIQLYNSSTKHYKLNTKPRKCVSRCVHPSVTICTVTKRYIQAATEVSKQVNRKSFKINNFQPLHWFYPLKLLASWTTHVGAIWRIH